MTLWLSFNIGDKLLASSHSYDPCMVKHTHTRAHAHAHTWFYMQILTLGPHTVSDTPTRLNLIYLCMWSAYPVSLWILIVCLSRWVPQYMTYSCYLLLYFQISTYGDAEAIVIWGKYRLYSFISVNGKKGENTQILPFPLVSEPFSYGGCFLHTHSWRSVQNSQHLSWRSPCTSEQLSSEIAHWG